MTSSVDSNIDHDVAIKYWSNVDSTVDGVLGGYSQISRIDLRGSLTFIAKLKRSIRLKDDLLERVADCGAGIGRITAGCLSRVAQTVDIIEPVEKFAEQAKALKPEELGAGKVGKVYQVGLEAWTPDIEAYDIIWNQWCLGQLTDKELVAYLGRCKSGLKPHGWVVVKENLNSAADKEDDFDVSDSSVTRSDFSWNRIFVEAGYKVVHHEVQKGFPKQLGLFPVKTYALRPV